MNKKLRLYIIDENYPNENNLYGDVFVHTRLLKYGENFDIKVVGVGMHEHTFSYQGIKVEYTGDKKKLIDKINYEKPDVLGIHFYPGWMVNEFSKKSPIPTFIWVHGAEALGWYRRLFNFSIKDIFGLLKYIIANVRQLYRIRKLIKLSNTGKSIIFIFVSEWMKSITEKDSLSTIKNYKIIHNPIDINLFKYNPKTPEKRLRILLIRSFDSKKYANDIAINAIKLLSKEHFFDELFISICGKGKMFDSLTKPIMMFKNVELIEKFIPNNEIPNIHSNYGIFLCPTRQDAQGVSMCEAMSSGLVPITSNNTAIPEFVNNDCGFLTNSPLEIVEAIKKLYFDEELFLQLSKKASEHIASICRDELIIKEEIAMLLGGIST
ncbi:hypothetical protein AGMMS50267_09840 [Spirochaetia bacterium]|nr:hypothetical protein AGMMS50267_09840 [Spirochaetia bacterium]